MSLWVLDLSNIGIVGSNPARRTDVCMCFFFVCVCCAVLCR